MSQSLWDIHDELERLAAQHTDAEGVFDEQFEGQLDELHLAKEQKILAVARYAMGEQAEAKMVKDQADRLAKRAQIHINKYERLKAYIGTVIEYGEKYADDIVRISTAKKPASVFVREGAEIEGWPEDFLRITYAADRKALLEAAKEGETLPEGVELRQTGWGVRLK